VVARRLFHPHPGGGLRWHPGYGLPGCAPCAPQRWRRWAGSPAPSPGFTTFSPRI
jgi:hypothetical protein